MIFLSYGCLYLHSMLQYAGFWDMPLSSKACQTLRKELKLLFVVNLLVVDDY